MEVVPGHSANALVWELMGGALAKGLVRSGAKWGAGIERTGVCEWLRVMIWNKSVIY